MNRVLSVVVTVVILCLRVWRFRYSWHKQRFFQKYGIKTKKTSLIIGDLPLIIKRVRTHSSHVLFEYYHSFL